MGSGSSSSKKTVKAEINQEKVTAVDMHLVKRLKDQTKSLEDIRGNASQLQEYIDTILDRQKANATGSRHGTPVTDRDGDPTITDDVEKLVDDIIEHVDEVNVSLDDLNGFLGLFHDAVLKRLEKVKSDEQKKNGTGAIQEIIQVLDKKVKSAKERLSVVKAQNVAPEIIKSTEAELKEHLKIKIDIEQHYKVLKNKRDELVKELKERGVDDKTITEVLRWKDDVTKLEQTHRSVIYANELADTDTDVRLKTLKESNEKLLVKMDTLQRQCLESDQNTQDAMDSVQKVEEKILEERLSHEVEINALKALLEQRNMLIKQLGGSDMDIPLSPSQDHVTIKAGKESKLPDTIGSKSGLLQNNQSVLGFGKLSQFREEETTDTDTCAGKHEQAVDECLSASTTPHGLSIVHRAENREGMTPEDIALNKYPNKGITSQSSTLVSTAVQVSEKDISEAVNMKLDLHEDSSSDLGLSVKSEFIQGTPDLVADDEDSDKDISNNSKGNVNKTHINHKCKDDSGISNTEMKKEIDFQPKPSLPDKDVEGDKIPDEDALPESFADMIQLVSKDDCITTLETTEDDVYMYEGTTKEIIYKRNDGGIDWDVAYHRGIGAVVRTTREEFGIDTIRVDIIDEVETAMLPDLVLGERPISFHLHVREKEGSNMAVQGDDVKIFVPHRPLKEYEDVTLIYSVNGADWEDCDLVDELPASVETNIGIVGAVLPDIRDVKLVAIARERMVDLIAGEGDISHVLDESIRVNITKDTFRSHTIAKLLVHHSHILCLRSAVGMHEECRSISSCTAFICIVCDSVTRSNILVDMDIPQSDVNADEECKYTMFCLNESGWKLADCTWDLASRRLTINLMPGSRSYRIIGVDLPMSIHMEERLAAVRSLHEHTDHYQVCVFVRQRLDDPQQAVVMCLRAQLAEQAISELSKKGFSMGTLISQHFCIMDGDVLSLEMTGNLVAKPVNSEKMTMTFYPQRELCTRLLILLPVDSDSQSKPSSGNLTIIKHETGENVVVLGCPLGLSQET